MAKYAFPPPFECACISCGTEFYTHEVVYPWWERAYCFLLQRDKRVWDGKCPNCNLYYVTLLHGRS